MLPCTSITSKYSSSRHFAISVHVSVSFLTVSMLEVCKVYCYIISFNISSFTKTTSNFVRSYRSEDLRLHGGLLISSSAAFIVSFFPAANVQGYYYFILVCNWDGMMFDSVVVFARFLCYCTVYD